MNYKNREVQPEFFCNVKHKQRQGIFQKNIFQDHYKSEFSISADTLVVVVIAGIMINLSGFVLGIERGKSIALQEANAGHVRAARIVKTKPEIPAIKAEGVAPAQPEAPQEITLEPAVSPEPPAEPESGYVIQLVTYKSDKYANEEVQRLKENGLTGFVKKTGDYYVVYSGKYASRGTAKEELGSYKKRYKDCFVIAFNK